MKKKPHSNCLNCSKETNRTTTKFCSKQCDNAYRSKNKIKRGGPKRTRENISCICGKIFYPKYRTTKYCSRHCMGMARRDDWIEFCKTRTGPRNLSLETRRKMSLAASKRNASRQYTKGIGGTRPDIGHYVRSSWEANIARVLQWAGVRYEYEPDIFQLKHGNKYIHYRPDFKIGNYYIEVKGWWNERSKLCKKLMSEQYPKTRIVYIDKKVYQEIENEFKKIPNWELKKRRC